MIVNPMTGERVRFVDDATLEAWWPPRRRRVPVHLHPKMEERWEVLSGRGAFRIGDEEVEIGPGESVVAPPNTPHTAYNPGDDEAHVRITMTPPLRWRAFIERLFATDPRDRRELAGLLAEFPDEIAGA